MKEGFSPCGPFDLLCLTFADGIPSAGSRLTFIYYDFNVPTHNKSVEKLRYIHRNPVRRGLVAKPEDWKWSSFRDLLKYSGFVSGHDFSRAEKARKMKEGFSPCGGTHNPELLFQQVLRHHQTGIPGTVEIDSEGAARQRGGQLPEWTSLHRGEHRPWRSVFGSSSAATTMACKLSAVGGYRKRKAVPHRRGCRKLPALSANYRIGHRCPLLTVLRVPEKQDF
jgi:hypothetical protein